MHCDVPWVSIGMKRKRKVKPASILKFILQLELSQVKRLAHESWWWVFFRIGKSNSEQISKKLKHLNIQPSLYLQVHCHLKHFLLFSYWMSPVVKSNWLLSFFRFWIKHTWHWMLHTWRGVWMCALFLPPSHHESCETSPPSFNPFNRGREFSIIHSSAWPPIPKLLQKHTTFPDVSYILLYFTTDLLPQLPFLLLCLSFTYSILYLTKGTTGIEEASGRRSAPHTEHNCLPPNSLLQVWQPKRK